MFSCNYKKLRVSFNEFHEVKAGDMPEYGEFCLLERKDGGYTGGEWQPDDDSNAKDTVEGKFVRGTGDTVPVEEVAKWHSLRRYDLTKSLEKEEVNWINLGVRKEDGYSVQFKHFKSIEEGKYPKQEQYCLLILKEGRLGVGRWERWRRGKGSFVYAPGLAQYRMEKVWAWTPLGMDDIFAAEEEERKERKREKELNRNPQIDPEMFRYGTDIGVYYEKALEKLRAEYSWASVAQMKKVRPWEIVPLHGKYVFGQVSEIRDYTESVTEWKEGSTAEEFIDYLCEYTRESVKNADPGEKFKLGLDIGVYLEKAYTKVKKDYRWADKKMLEKTCRYAIKKVKGEWEFVRDYNGNGKYFVCEHSSAESFIEEVERSYQEAALRANPAVAEYALSFGRIEIHGWYLERYAVSRLQSGDYKVDVQAGDRVTGGSREFFITPDCFEADSYEEFLDRYLKIVPGSSFGLGKEELLADEELKKFLGY